MAALRWGLLVLAGFAAAGRPIAEFAAADQNGQVRRLSDYDSQQLVVVVFLGSECPLAKLYCPRLNELSEQFQQRGVAFLAINSNHGDTFDGLARFAQQQQLRFPLLKDADAALADQFCATRQLEVFVLDRSRTIQYHGRVDDQYQPGVRHSQPHRADLQIAIEELLAGSRAVSVRETDVFGCFIQRRPPQQAAASITYCRQVAPILNRHCVECHRPGQIGPFSLTSFADAAAWSATIRERIIDGKMPPWHADPHFGKFANERRLTDRDRELLFAWFDAGMPEGDPADLSPQPKYADQWNIGRPDKVVTMPEPFQVPAQGTLDNVAVELDPGFREDTWIRGTEVRPGNRSVVHHCTVFIGPPGCNDLVDTGKPGLQYFSDFVPGLMPSLLPAGMARKVPAGWHIYLSLHYVPNGTPAADQTSLGMVLSRQVEREVFTGNLLNNQFTIPPHQANCSVEQSWTVPHDMLLLSLFPHMHLRGKSFRYEATHPSGITEVLLDVPRYDFMWQHRYILAEPKLLAAGTVLRGVAVYDNSAGNPANPDPEATVRYGKRTTDEMFHGYFDGALIDREPARTVANLWLAAALALGFCMVLHRRAARVRTH